MTSPTPTFLITRMFGITASGFLSGFAFSASYYTSPAIALAPISLQLRQWQIVYDLGKLISPPLSAISAAAWGLAAWHEYDKSEDWRLYATAGLLALAVPVWTVVVMRPVNNDLMAGAKRALEMDVGVGVVSTAFEGEVKMGLKRWDGMNMVRAVLPMVGAWVGLYAALK